MYMYMPWHNQWGNNLKILDYKWGDVTGDRVLDLVYLVGEVPDESSPFVKNITLVVQNGRTGYIMQTTFENNAGYDPKLFLADFTGDNVLDIQVSIASGGSGGFYFNYIYSALNNQFRMLFDYDQFNETYIYEVNYLDDYKVQVISEYLGLEFIIDITYKGQEYLDQLYDQNGKLIKPVQGNVYGLVALYPVDVNNDNVFELQAWQSISGLYHADGLGNVLTLLKWNGSEFEAYNQLVAIYGAEL